MTSQNKRRDVGTISFVGNRILWTITKFSNTKKNTRFKSPQFTLMGTTWQLRYCYFKCTLSFKEWVDIDVKLLSKTSTIKGQKARFGITGNNLEIAKTLESDDLSKNIQLTLLYGDEMHELVPDGNLCVFFAMKKREVNCKTDMPLKMKATGNAASKYAGQNTNVEVSTETEEKPGDENSKQADRDTCEDESTQTEEINGIWKLQQDLRDAWLNGNASDIVLKVEDEEFKCHKFILAARCPVFFGAMMERAQDKNSNVVDIQGVDSYTFSHFLRYLYTGCVGKIESLDNFNLIAIADMYEIIELKKMCMDLVTKNISSMRFGNVLAKILLEGQESWIAARDQLCANNASNGTITFNWE